jgi:DNA-binding NarL/FixJ family response regulator
MISVIIADDHRLVAEGIQKLIDESNAATVVAIAGNLSEAISMVASKQPDIMLLDVAMPDGDGIDAIAKIKEAYGKLKIIVLTIYAEPTVIRRALESGADGYILKEMDNEKIINSIKAVSGGMNVFCANVFSSMKQNMQSAPPAPSPSEDLTERDIELLRLIAQGCDNKMIATKLFLAEGTIRNNISRLLEKLGLKDRTQLAVYAVKNNIV